MPFRLWRIYNATFLQQVYFGEQLHIGVKVAHIGNSSVDLHYVGKKQDGTIAFTGRGTMVQMSKNDRKRSRLGRKRTCAIS
ncbi:hypothetical protein LR68_01540 [Anoxybacillus sp. BCO1]|nr:hypothetical protein LR68_01540 [Anoxybacillus sp. BCO1]